MKLSRLLLAVVISAPLLGAQCSYIDDPPNVARIAISTSAITMRVGESTQLAATPLGTDGLPMSKVTIGWASSAPDVVRAQPSTGRLDALAPGHATVSATGRGKTTSVPVTVLP